MTLGSLFDGIAGFPLAAERQGIKTIWTSEIEANCTDIAKRHFPDAENLGDITKINGGNIPAVDIISFGSPCQDLSVAGEQKGLDGARSGLFMEAVRIVREMRFCPVPEIRHKEWKKRGLMPPMKPEETPEFSFSDLQMTLYNTIYI